MPNGLRISRNRHIHIYVDWSGVIIFQLVVWALTGAVLLNLQPQLGLALGWGMALIASILFFASLLAHELAHALVAIAKGMPAYNITLFPFSGVSKIPFKLRSPAAEFIIALMGPLISILLGGIILFLNDIPITGVDQIVNDPGRALVGLAPISMFLFSVGFVNVLIGVFNLIPGLPLDGGSILHSILWAAIQDRQRATQWTSWIGRVTSWGLAATGIAIVVVVPLSFGGIGFFGGLALVCIGWLLNRAAEQTYLQRIVENYMANLPTARLTIIGELSVPPNIPISSLVRDYIIGSGEWACSVIDQGCLVGLVHFADIRNTPFERWDTTEVGEIMRSVYQLKEGA